MSPVVLLFVLFFFKHFICDFPLQSFPYMYKNKGTYGHPGGLLHAGIHAVFTGAIGLFFTPWLALGLAITDFIVHYHIDWAKMKLNAKMGWKPDNSEKFWVLLGIDQLLHYLTYAYLVTRMLST